MKKIFLLLFIPILSILSSCQKEDIIDYTSVNDTEFDKGSSIVFPELNERLLTDLELLGKIWGFLKYHHPEVGKGKYNWDYELFRILPQYLKARNKEDRDEIILNWINKYGKISVCTTCKETPDAFIKPDLSWAENSNMNKILKEKIKEIYHNRHQGKHYYIRMTNIGNPEFINEKSYSDLVYPDIGFRLLALYRYWNMIHYFFPDKYLADKNWDDLLKEYIPIFLVAENRLEYELSILEILSEIGDSHAVLSGKSAVGDLRGDNYAPFRVWFVEGKLVVTDYYNWSLKPVSSIEIGDIITHINGEAVESIVKKIKKYYPASNDASKLRNISFDLLRSKNTTIDINYISSGQAGQKKILLYNRNMLNIYSWYIKKGKCYEFINDDIGYITIASVTIEDIPDIKKSFRNAKGIIIDIRNYPPIWPSTHIKVALGSWFVFVYSPYAKCSMVNIDNPGEFTLSPLGYITNSGETYRGKVIVLVNEITQSSAEAFALTFRSGVNTTIIGSRTSGSLGATSTITLPGGFETMITAIGYYNPDGTPTQRVGIVPDVWIEPTIEGIRQGRDELLEKAISLINEE